MSFTSARDAQKDNPYVNYFIRGQSFTLKHKETFLERITEMHPKYLGKVHSDLLCSAVIRIKSTDDPLIQELETILSMGRMVSKGEITRDHLASLIETHRSTWEPKVNF